MDFSQYLLLGAVIAGVTELLIRLRARDFWTATTVLSAAIVGGLFGYFGYEGIPDVVTGLAAGFGASGALSAFHAFSSAKSPAEPSKAFGDR